MAQNEATSLQSGINQATNHKSKKSQELIKIEIETHDVDIHHEHKQESQDRVSINSANTLAPSAVSVSANSANSNTQNKLNDIMDEVLGEPTRSGHISNILSPPLKSKTNQATSSGQQQQPQQTASNHVSVRMPSSNPQTSRTDSSDIPTATTTNTAPSSNRTSNKSLNQIVGIRTDLTRNDSIPVSNVPVLMFNKTEKKKTSRSNSYLNIGIENIENIIIPKSIGIHGIEMNIGQSIRSPAHQEDDDTNTDELLNINNNNGGGGGGGDNKKESTSFVHGLVTGQLTPTMGSGYSHQTGVTSFQRDHENINNNLLGSVGMDSRDIQLTPYDLDEEEEKKVTSYPNMMYDHHHRNNNNNNDTGTGGRVSTNNTSARTSNNNNGITPTPHTNNTHQSQVGIGFENVVTSDAMKRMMTSTVEFTTVSSDGYNTVDKGIRMEMQNSDSFQSSILPLPDDMSGTQQTLTLKGYRAGKEQNEHDSLSFADHESIVSGLKNRYPSKQPQQYKQSNISQTMPSHTLMRSNFSDSNGTTKNRMPDLIPEISNTNTLDQDKEIINNNHNNNNNNGNVKFGANTYSYLYDDDNGDDNVNINNAAQDEDEDSLDIGSVITQNTNRTMDTNSMIPYSDHGSVNIYSPSIIKDQINTPQSQFSYYNTSKINQKASHVPKFQDGKRSFISDMSEYDAIEESQHL